MSVSMCVNTERGATGCGVLATGSFQSRRLADALKHST